VAPPMWKRQARRNEKALTGGAILEVRRPRHYFIGWSRSRYLAGSKFAGSKFLVKRHAADVAIVAASPATGERLN